MSRLTVSERIAGSAYRHWMRAKMTEWPTVRTVCRRLRISQRNVEACEGDGSFSLTAYNVTGGQLLGDHFVEADTPEVEQAWAEYWRSWQAGRKEQ